MSEWGFISPSPGHTAAAEDKEGSFPGIAVCPEGGTVQSQLALCLSICASHLLVKAAEESIFMDRFICYLFYGMGLTGTRTRCKDREHFM